MLVSSHRVTPQDMAKIANDLKFDVNFAYPSSANTIYQRDENTGACVDVCVERKTGENGIFIIVFSKWLKSQSALPKWEDKRLGG